MSIEDPAAPNAPQDPAPAAVPDGPITLAEPGKLRIFISYKEVDKDTAVKIKRRLKSLALKDVDIFVAADPQENKPGGHWRPTIAKALNNADVLILLFTNPDQDWGW